MNLDPDTDRMLGADWQIRSELAELRDYLSLPDGSDAGEVVARAKLAAEWPSVFEIIDEESRAEIIQRATGVLLPPPGLPSTLSTIDDVRQVCEAAGLEPTSAVGCHGDGSALVVAPTEAVWPLPVYCYGDPMRVVASIHRNAPTALLWHAIQAARSAS